MSETDVATEEHDEPRLTEIRIKGHLDQRWAAWFDGLSITLEDNGETRLIGLVVDQAALLDVKSLLTDAGPRALRPARFWADGRVAALEPPKRVPTDEQARRHVGRADAAQRFGGDQLAYTGHGRADCGHQSTGDRAGCKRRCLALAA